MHITYAIITYFLIFVLLFTLSLILFLIPKFRHKFVAFINKYSLTLDNQILYTTLYFTFSVLIAVLMDSGWTFKDLYYQSDFESYSHSLEIELQNYKQDMPLQKEIYLAQFRKNRQYFIAQKNFILAWFALFAWFVFCRILMFIVEITENQISIKEKQLQKQSKPSNEKEGQKIQNSEGDSSNKNLIRDALSDLSNKEEREKSGQPIEKCQNINEGLQKNNIKSVKQQ